MQWKSSANLDMVEREETFENSLIVKLKSNDFLKHSKLEWKKVIYTEDELN